MLISQISGFGLAENKKPIGFSTFPREYEDII